MRYLFFVLILLFSISVHAQDKPKGDQFAPTDEETRIINSAYDRLNKARAAYQKAQEQAELIMSNAQKEAEAAELQGQLILMRIGKTHGKDMDLYKVATAEDGKPIFVRKEAEVANTPPKVKEEAKK